MKVINTISQINGAYLNELFSLDKWKDYIKSINNYLEQICLNDMNNVISTTSYTFEKDFLPILNAVIKDEEKLKELDKNFNIVIENLDNKIINQFGKSINVEIILYLGLCNGAGWVEIINNKTYCLLGIEKILELKWYDIDSLYGLIYHELGHVYQNQYGILIKEFDNYRHQFLWQLFTEGIAMYFEQTLVGDYNYYHQNKEGWKKWCDQNLNLIKKDFYNDLNYMTNENQNYFGDWVLYNNYNDVGYYLGTKFVQYICKRFSFNSILSLDIFEVEQLYLDFLNC